MSCRTSWLAASALLLSSSAAWALGVQGDPAAVSRVGGGIATGVDQVGGYAQDAYPFVELYGHAEARVRRWLYLAAGLSYRQDINDYNHANGRWRDHQSPGLAVQTLIGYDSDAFHISVGPWLYGSSRRRPDFRAGVLPFGLLRIRFGQLAGWHGSFQLGEGAPFTATGGYSARMMLGGPARGMHRLSGGLYTSVGENVAGLIAVDELTSKSSRYRIGASLGSVMDHIARVEMTAFCGVLW